MIDEDNVPTVVDPGPDYASEPGIFRCPRCRSEHRWVWYHPKRAYKGRSGWWVAPKHDPCSVCEGSTAAEDRGVFDRLRTAGVPEPLWRYVLEDHGIEQQRGAETAESFQARVRLLDPPKLGIPTSNAEAMRTAWRFLATARPIALLVMTGPPGTGKTTWLAAIARRLLSIPPERWTTSGAVLPLAGERTMHRRGIRAVECERVKLRGLDPHPTVDVARVPVLLLDELGLDPHPKEAERKLVERLITFRWDRRLPTLIATNRTIDELTDQADPLYGDRVADRLRATTQVTLGGPSWRA
jgi:hypothetical protein